jgi:hypothetical protein
MNASKKLREGRELCRECIDNVGSSMYWATTAELQSAIPGVPQQYDLNATAFIDAGGSQLL